MTKQNGYFQLQIEEDGLYIHLFPPTEGGDPIVVSEVLDYLNMVKVEQYDLNALSRTIHSIQEPTLFRLNDDVAFFVSEKSKIEVSPDRMTATIRLYPPSNNGKMFEKKDLFGELNRAGIRTGVILSVLDLLIKSPVYCYDVVVAKGKPAKEGIDAQIEYLFDTKPTAKPKLNEDGTVDFHQLGIFTRVEKGQLLARLTPEQEGEDGIDVFGNRVPPLHKVRKGVLKCGRNIHLSDDHLEMYSDVSGDVKLEGDTVFVSDTFTVQADVDASTGDIDYDGNVIVNGNVRTGFRIVSQGDIHVKGVVEGAELYAEGNIVLNRGIQGMNRGKLDAKGDIITKFIESATVKAGGKIQAGSILHSNVEAGDSITCEGRKSFVIGGFLSAVNLIDAKTVGNQMGTVTTIKLGVDASVLEDLKKKQEEFAENAVTIEKCTQILTLFKKRLESGQKVPPDKVAVIQTAGNDKQRLEERQEVLKQAIEECQQLIEANAKGRLRIGDMIYPGVRVSIANNLYIVKNELKYCQFHLRQGEVVVDSY